MKKTKVMQEIIDEVYKLTYHQIATPKAILDWIRLDNYESLRYYKENNQLVCEVKCTLDTGEKGVFWYIFDEDEKLVLAKSEIEGKAVPDIFNRAQELQEERLKFEIEYQKQAPLKSN